MPTPELTGRFIKVLSLNALFQDPWAPLTGGAVQPFDPVGDHPSRIAAVVAKVAEEAPDVFMGQEFDSIGAQDEFIARMRDEGFQYFIRDLGSNDPVRNHSGLLIASKVPLKDHEFVPYPSADRSGLAKMANQGALCVGVMLGDQELQLVNVHLNYGESPSDQQARYRQLRHHVLPRFDKPVPTVVLGDLNFDTEAAGEDAGLGKLKNALEGQVTCTDEGKHTLRGKPRENCDCCAEKIDGVIYDPEQVTVTVESKELKEGDLYLSDHTANIATITLGTPGTPGGASATVEDEG